MVTPRLVVAEFTLLKIYYTRRAEMLKRLIGFVVVGLMAVWGIGHGAQTVGISPEGIRADGMGGAYTGVAEGPEGVFYNPAGLTKMKNSLLVLPGLYLKGNQDAVTYITNIKAYDKLTKADCEKLKDLKSAAKGFAYVGLFNPSWALNVYGIRNAFLLQADLAGAMYSETWSYGTDVGMMLTIAGKLPKLIPILDFSYGVNLKYVYRMLEEYKVDVNCTTKNVTSKSPSNVSPQHGWGVDAGLNCKVLGFVDVGVMFKDLYSKIGSDTVPTNMTIGASTKLLNFITLSMDFADLVSSQGDFLDKVKIGAEISLFGFIKARGGLSQKYPTLGAGITFLFLNVDYAFMGEKLIGQDGQTLSQNPIGSHAISCSLIF